MNKEAKAEALAQQKPKRSLLRPLLLIGVPVIAIVGIGAYYLHGGRFAETENAYVQSTLTPIAPEISGTVKEVLAVENQRVKAGDVIFRIDDASFKVAVDRDEAKLNQVKIDYTVLRGSYAEKQAEIASAKTKSEYADKTLQRQTDLSNKNVAAAATLDDAAQAAQLAKQSIDQTQLQLDAIVLQLGGDPNAPLEKYPAYLSAQADLDQAKLDLAHTEIKAPADGFVSKLPSKGQYIIGGPAAVAATPAFAFIAANGLRVDANFTETEVTYVKPGQSVDVTVDTYPDMTWHGTVDSISPATGSAFSVIPSENATGNWVKIAQRIPVRIKLDVPADAPQLRIGQSAYVSVDTGHQRSFMGLHF